MQDHLTQITNYLWTQSWQIAVLIVVIAAASLALKNKSAHVRYLLWLIVLAKCLVPPLLIIPLAVLPQEKPAMVLETMDTSVAVSGALPSAPLATAPVPTLTEIPARFTIRQCFGFGWFLGAVVFVLVASIKRCGRICGCGENENLYQVSCMRASQRHWPTWTSRCFQMSGWLTA